MGCQREPLGVDRREDGRVVKKENYKVAYIDVVEVRLDEAWGSGGGKVFQGRSLKLGA
jgi:hypothetical protein